ncbi:MAG TPA: hypothetical protein VMV90_09405 [Rectinemataceae bacterium]|nr:hypothetical protein [Rectinemataceae bacterium]
MTKEPCSLELDVGEALALYIFFRGCEEELPDAVAAFAGRIRDYLYDRLSIEEMERPEKLLSRLNNSR